MLRAAVGPGIHGNEYIGGHKKITTLTLNPAIDSACEAETVHHTRKIRTLDERYDPGGGGINVARVVKRLGGKVDAIYLAGGATGGVLDELLQGHGIEGTRLDIADHTRVSLAVYERSSGREFRFVPEGPLVEGHEWQACLELLAGADCDYLVASGSLPRGVPDDFYARLRVAIGTRPVRLVLDTSGAALRDTLAQGGVFLVKPSLGELERMLGRSLAEPDALLRAASDIVERGEAEHVAVTLGGDGALLVNSDGAIRLPGLPIVAKSAVGAGDSFLAGMTYGFASGLAATDAFRLGVASGTAAVLTPGNDLCHRADVDRLLHTVPDCSFPVPAETPRGL